MLLAADSRKQYPINKPKTKHPTKKRGYVRFLKASLEEEGNFVQFLSAGTQLSMVIGAPPKPSTRAWCSAELCIQPTATLHTVPNRPPAYPTTRRSAPRAIPPNHPTIPSSAIPPTHPPIQPRVVLKTVQMGSTADVRGQTVVGSTFV